MVRLLSYSEDTTLPLGCVAASKREMKSGFSLWLSLIFSLISFLCPYLVLLDLLSLQMMHENPTKPQETELISQLLHETWSVHLYLWLQLLYSQRLEIFQGRDTGNLEFQSAEKLTDFY